MRMKYQILVLFISLNAIAYGQWKDISLLVKVGSANYDLVIPVGLNSNSDWWGNSAQLSLGIEYPLNEDLSLQGLFLFSNHSLINNYLVNIEQDNPQIRLFDFMCNLKWNIGYFYVIGGIGLSFRHIDEIGFIANGIYYKMEFLGSNKTVKAALLGIGFDIKIINQLNLIAESNINVRTNWGTALLVGLKYHLFKNEE